MSRRLLEDLGVREAPLPEEVVKHLLHSARRGEAVNLEVYRELNRLAPHPALEALVGKECLLLPDEGYVGAQHVFWVDHPFGRFRKKLGPEFAEYGAMLEQLKVKDVATCHDALVVLADIAKEFGPFHDQVTEEADQNVVWTCWRMLQQGLDSGVLSPSDLKVMVSLAVVPDRLWVLTRPAHVFFDDMPGLAEEFGADVLRQVIRRPEGAWRALKAAGVSDMSAAVDVDIVELRGQRPAADVRSRIRERVDLLVRVLDPSMERARETIEDRLSGLILTEAEAIGARFRL